MVRYWADSLSTILSQGDVVPIVLWGTSTFPTKPLVAGATLKGGVDQWLTGEWKPDNDGISHFVGKGRMTPVIVLSYGCDIDKSKKNEPISVAPVFPLTNVGDATFRQIVRDRKRFPFFPLAAIDGVLPESYVDLRCITYVQAGAVNQNRPIGSASDHGLSELTEHLVGFFTRLHLPKGDSP